MKFPDKLPRGITEADFGREIERCAKHNGWLFCHIRPLPLPKRGGKWITPASTGFPDYMFVHPRVRTTLALEIKRTGGKVSPQQKEWLRLLGRSDGIDAFIAYPDDWPNVRQYLEAPNHQPRVADATQES